MGSFTIDTNARIATVRIAMRGLFSLSDVAALGATQTAAVERAGFAPGGFDAIVDVSESPIQHHEVADALNRLAGDPGFRPRRIAFVTGNAGVRMQVRRLGQDHGAGCFATVGEAEAWLAAAGRGPSPDRAAA